MRSPLTWVNVNMGSTDREYQFQIHLYWPDGAYRNHVTAVLPNP